jgi:phenylalanyl-tRNA synthetase alpha chain
MASTQLLQDLEDLQAQGRRQIEQAQDADQLDALKVKFLGRKEGLLTRILQALPTLPAEEKKEVGRRANEAKTALESALEDRKRSIENARLEKTLSSEKPDLTLPGVAAPRGKLHPLTQVMEEITDVFLRLGFNLAEGPEIETDFNNFTALNHPPDHPARDAHDTFYVKGLKDEQGLPLLLRTHTSPVQVRWMKARKPPVYIVAPGRVFRHEAVDATHSFVFHQFEGLAVDEGLSLADLKGVLSAFAQAVFGSKAQIRFAPSFFPFVEPGIEVSISCTICGQKGCRVCKGTGWVEMLGAGMVHWNVLRAVGYDPKKVSGWAFGIGVERVAMFKYGVDDMRLFYENDLRFLEQF